MKRISLLLVLVSLFIFHSSAQISPEKSRELSRQTFPLMAQYHKIEQLVLPRMSVKKQESFGPNVDCSVLQPPLIRCSNLIANNNFRPTPLYDPNNPAIYLDPFTTTNPPYGYVPSWEAAQGDPNIDDVAYKFFYGTSILPPPPATGYASMFAGYHATDGLMNEGIAQKIAPLIPGRKYVFSFFKLYTQYPSTPTASSDFNIVLMKCTDFPLIYPQNPQYMYATPPIPVNAQVIYCETSINHTDWRQKVISFVANNDYDMIWIFPKGRTDQYYGSMVDFAYPELKDVGSFSAGTNPVATSDNCMVTIGPSTPNTCRVANAIFTWHGPNGQVVAAPANQQIQVNTSVTANLGTWTLIMSASGEIPTNNTCSQALSASVTVSACPSATTGQWTWMKGDNIPDQPGIYGTQGVPAAANKPGSRYYEVGWTDLSGNFWMFGGADYNTSSGQVNDLNDLWKYNPGTNEWTWVKGDNVPDQPAVYGTQGVPSPANKPGARQNAATWKDNAGNLWLFGGFSISPSGQSYYNDLWKYNISTNEWTWMKGSTLPNQYGIYGTQGVPSASNCPGGRISGTCWTDASGNFWLYGGGGYAISGFFGGSFNDLWRYNPATNEWTWMKGGNNIVSNFGIYGTKGIGAPGNRPGGKMEATGWTDNAGNLWLYGGFGFAASTTGFLNDLWKYSIGSNEWTWVHGDSVSNQLGIYGTQGTPSPTAKPGGRWLSAAWQDATGALWLFGGRGYGGSGSLNGNLSDLWKYNISTNQWTWVNGSTTINTAANYGTLGVPGPLTQPGGRWGRVSWLDNSGRLWLFGTGLNAIPTDPPSGSGQLNDLWRYIP